MTQNSLIQYLFSLNLMTTDVSYAVSTVPLKNSPILLLEHLECLDELSRNHVTNLTMLVGDINFDNTNWHHMEPSNLDEVLEELFEQNYQQLITGAKKQVMSF